MPLPSNMVQAVYRESEIPSYRGNPLIEALPPTLNLKQLKLALIGDVPFDPGDIYADGRQRAHIISSLLDDFFQPLPAHIQLEEKLSILIRRGYVGRNLNDGSLNTHLQNGYERVMSGDLETMRFRHAQSTALSLSLIGCSGSGKTTTLNRILSTYPQVIHHPGHNFTQITFLKVDCPHDSSLKSLCIQFFRALDRVLHSDYEAKYTRKRHSVETLLALMGQTANAFAVGTLIIASQPEELRRHRQDAQFLRDVGQRHRCSGGLRRYAQGETDLRVRSALRSAWGRIRRPPMGTHEERPHDTEYGGAPTTNGMGGIF